MTPAERAMGLGLRALGRFASLDVIDRVGLRKPAERLLYRGTMAAGKAGRTFAAVTKLAKPARQAPRKPADLFDLTPDDEQQMLQEAFGSFAADKLRPAAAEADADSAAPKELLEQANELGVTMLGVPAELDGPMAERSTVTSVLAAEALAHGDMGLAVAILAPGAVSTAIGLWGNADQQARYLPPFTGEDPPAAALALLEPQPLFDPLAPKARARRTGDGFVLEATKSLVPRGADAELFVVGAELEGSGPALFIVESKSEGVFVEPEPAMGLRAASLARVVFDDVKLGPDALLGEGQPGVYAECVRRARLAWCALAVGTAQATLDYVIPYVNQREAFGEPISHRQAVAFAVSDIAIELEGMRLTTWRAASLADQGKDFARETAVARRLCAEKGMQIGSQGVQLLGGHGYVKEHPVERWYRDLRAAGVMEGGVLV